VQYEEVTGAVYIRDSNSEPQPPMERIEDFSKDEERVAFYVQQVRLRLCRLINDGLAGYVYICQASEHLWFSTHCVT
jgi:hypothetical protein